MPMDSRALDAMFRQPSRTGWQPPRCTRRDRASSIPSDLARRRRRSTDAAIGAGQVHIVHQPLPTVRRVPQYVCPGFMYVSGTGFAYG